MQFIHPWLLLGLVFVPVAVLLHVFRAPGRRHEVSSLGLWRGVLEHVRPEATERLKRFDWLLLLELLVVILLVLALAWPVVWIQRPHRYVGGILDISASMKTVDPDGKMRWDKVEDSIRPIDQQKPEADDKGRVVYAPTEPDAEQLSGSDWFFGGIRNLGDHVAAPEKVLADGLSALGHEPQVIFLVTDKPPAKIDDPRVRVVAVGGPSRNAGIVGFSGESAPDGSLELFLRVANYADAEQSRRIVVTNASKEIASDGLRLPPNGGALERVFKVRVAADDPVVRVKLEGPADGFAADDEVAGVVKPLAVVATGKKITPAYARLFGGTVFDGTVYLQAPDNASLPPDALVIAEGVVPTSLSAVAVVVGPPAGEIGGIKIGSLRMLAQPASPIAAGGDPLTTGVNLSEIRLADFSALTLSETARPLMRVAGEVVAAVSDVAGSQVIVLGFDPTRAGWTLQPSFVVFWANVLAEAKRVAGVGGLVFYRTGDVVRLPVGFDKGFVEGPGGREDLVPDKDGWCIYQPTRAGAYHWSGPSGAGWFAANLLSEIESDNRPSPLVGKPPSFDLPAPLAGKSIPLGPWLCLASGIFAALWWHFRR